MKKTLFSFAAAIAAVAMLSSCGNKANNSDTTGAIEGEVVGEELVMPSESAGQTDTTVIAEGEAEVVVDTAAPAK